MAGQRAPALWPQAPPGSAMGREGDGEGLGLGLGRGLGLGELFGLGDGLARTGPGLPVPYAPPGRPQPSAAGVSWFAGMGFFIQPAMARAREGGREGGWRTGRKFKFCGMQAAVDIQDVPLPHNASLQLDP